MHKRTVEESQELDTPDVDTDFTPQVVNPDSVAEKNTTNAGQELNVEHNSDPTPESAPALVT